MSYNAPAPKDRPALLRLAEALNTAVNLAQGPVGRVIPRVDGVLTDALDETLTAWMHAAGVSEGERDGLVSDILAELGDDHSLTVTSALARVHSGLL